MDIIEAVSHMYPVLGFIMCKGPFFEKLDKLSEIFFASDLCYCGAISNIKY
jgi:hypothetical protein